MYKIGYIEPCSELLKDKYPDPFLQINDLLFRRLEGIRKAVIDNPEIHFDWLNRNTDLESFLQNGDYKEYDGVIITAPDSKDIPLIEKYQDSDTAFLVSADADPGVRLNYVGPDHERDLSNILDAVKTEGLSRIGLIALHPERPDSKEIIEAAKKIFPKRGLAFDNSNIIGCDVAAKAESLKADRSKAITELIAEEILKHKEKDLFILIDSGFSFGVYSILLENYNIRIPEDIKLITLRSGPHFPPRSRDLALKIACINQDYYTIGHLSIRCLVEMLSGKRAKRNNKILVPGYFVKGSSFQAAFPLDTRSNEYFKSSVVNYINNNYMLELSARSIARALDLSYGYFINKFKACFGIGLKDYVNQIRLEKAVNLLTTTDIDMITLFTEVGFTHRSTFNRLFKKKFGMTPAEYRENKS